MQHSGVMTHNATTHTATMHTATAHNATMHNATTHRATQPTVVHEAMPPREMPPRTRAERTNAVVRWATRALLAVALLAGFLLLAGAALTVAPRVAQAQCIICDPGGGDQAPGVAITPSSGSFAGPGSTFSLQVTVEFCDDFNLMAQDRVIRVNGVDVTSSFSYTTITKAGCGAAARSVGTVNLRSNPPSNSITASIQDFVANVGSGSASYTYVEDAYPVVSAGSTTPASGTAGTTLDGSFARTELQSGTWTAAGSVAGQSAVVVPGGTVSLAVTVSDAVGLNGVSWEVRDPNGTLKTTLTSTATGTTSRTVTASYAVPSTAVQGRWTFKAIVKDTRNQQTALGLTARVAAPASVVVSTGGGGTSANLLVNQTLPVTAVAKTSDGLVLSGMGYTWTTTSSTVATVVGGTNGSGTITGKASSGTATIKATTTSGGSLQGSFTVKGATVQNPTLAVATVNPGTTVERGLCLTVAMGAGAASECGDLRLIHGLPVTRTMNKPRAPTLLYGTQEAHPYPVVAANIGLSSTAAVPDTVVATLTVGSTVVSTGKWAGSDWHAGRANRIVLGYDALTTPTGIVGYTMSVELRYNSTTSKGTASSTGELIVVNRAASPFGAGWWLVGLEQLVFVDPSQARILWLGGDGSAKAYTRVGTTNTWKAANLTRPDSITFDGTTYTRHLGNKLRVIFNGLGQHRYTVNRVNDTTRFSYNPTTGTLDTISVAPTAAGKQYRFVYGNPGGRVSSVVAPANTGEPRTTTVTVNASGDITKITDVDGTSVQFGVNGSYAHEVTSRTDELGHVTSFGYDAGHRVLTSTLTVPGAETIVNTVRSLETRGLAGQGISPAAPDTGAAYALIDGPRSDVGDSTRLWLDRYGAVRKVVNALGDSTVLTRADPTFSELVTQMRAPNGTPNGLTTQATYDAKGRVLTSTVLDPLGQGPGHDATTTYRWDAVWDAVTVVKAPLGDSVVTAYDPTTGNRLYQQDARGDSTRVTYQYNTHGQVTRIQAPLTRPQVFTYDPATLNLVQLTDPNQAVTHFTLDAIGRTVVTTTPVDSAGALFRIDSAYYDRMDRDTLNVTVAPPTPYVRHVRTGFGSNEVVTRPGGVHRVRQTYDSLGERLSVTQTVSPDSAHIGAIAQAWHYDAAGRVVAAIASDGHVDSTFYDAAGNVIRAKTRRGYFVTASYDALNRVTERLVPPVTMPIEVDDAGMTWVLPRYLPAAGSDGQDASQDAWDRVSTASDLGTTLLVGADTLRFVYNNAGQMIQADNVNARVRRGYNPAGALVVDTLIIRPLTATGTPSDWTTHVYVVTHQYDLNGRVIETGYPTGLVPPDPSAPAGTTPQPVRYHYSSVSGALDTLTGVWGKPFTFTYDALGRPTTSTRIGNPEVSRYDSAGQFIGRRLGSLGDAIHDELRTYDLGGRLLTITDTADNVNSGATTQSTCTSSSAAVTSDPGGESPGVVCPTPTDDNQAVPANFSTSGANAYDGFGHLIHTESRSMYQDGSPEEEDWFDPFGNMFRLGRVMHTTREAQPGPEGYEFFAFQPGTGRLLTMRIGQEGDPDPAHAIPGLGTQYFYDQAGNTIIVSDQGGATGPDGLGHEQVEVRRTWYNALEQAIVVDRRACQHEQMGSACDTTLALDYTVRPVFEEYRYDALGRRILVRTRQDWLCPRNCMLTVRRVIWDGSQMLAEIAAPGATSTPVADREADTGLAPHWAALNLAEDDPGAPAGGGHSTGRPGYMTGRVLYVNGPTLDRPLALIRAEYADSLAQPLRLLPVTNWQGHYDWQFDTPPCRVLQTQGAQLLPPPEGEVDPRDGGTTADTIHGSGDTLTVFCAQPKYPAAYRWVSRLDRSRGVVGPDGWYGSVLEELKDATGQIYQRNRYYDPASGRFTQEDPIGLAGGLNLYGYAGGDPVNFDDPFGLAADPITGAVVVATGKAVTIVGHAAVAAGSTALVLLGQALLNVADDIAGNVVGTAESLVPKVHGNSLETLKPAQGYTLRDRTTGEVLKYGETTLGKKRYSAKYLERHNAVMVFQAKGTKKEMHDWQHEQILEYKAQHDGKRPPLNKSDW